MADQPVSLPAAAADAALASAASPLAWPALRKAARRPATLIGAGLMIALTLVLSRIPLFNLVGYEFALAVALLATPIAALLGGRHVVAARKERLAWLGRGPWLLVFGLHAETVVVSLAMLLGPPLLLMSANALLVRNCSFLEGLGFYLLMPVLGVVAAGALGVAVGLTMERWVGLYAVALVVATSWIWSLLRFYFTPTIFAFDPYFGYFPGTLYDEAVAVRAPLWIYRAQTLLGVLGVLALAVARLDPERLRLVRRGAGPAGSDRRRGASGLAALLLTAAFLLWGAGGALGFGGNRWTIGWMLGGKRVTDHFVIHYDPSGPFARELDAVAEDHEFRYAQVRKAFGLPPQPPLPDGHKLRSFLFNSAAQKQALMGAADTFIAKPWRREVYLQYMAYPHPVLKHEIAHVVAAEFANPPFRIAARAGGLLPVPGLIEGAAVAAAWNADRLTVDQWAKAMREVGLAPPMRRILGLGFLAHSGARSYTMAGSFCHFLIERYGAARFQRAYRQGGLDGVYDKDISELEREWQASLAKVELGERDRALALDRFRRPSILRRHCAHEIARLRRQAASRRSAGNLRRALLDYRRIARLEPDDPQNLYDLAVMERAAGAHDAAAESARRLIAHPKATPTQKSLGDALLGDLAWRKGELERARRHYHLALGRALGDADERLLVAKLEATVDRALERSLRRVLIDDPPFRDHAADLYHFVQATVAAPERWLGWYLLGRNLVNAREWTEAEGPLRRALELGLPPAFADEARRLQGYARLRAGQPGKARVAFQEIADNPRAPEGLRVQARDWIERCDRQRP